MDRRLSEIYYSTGGYWKGYAAIGKLGARAGVAEDDAKTWLEKQALWRIYITESTLVCGETKLHSPCRLILDKDTQGEITFKNALVVVDVVSRYVDAEELPNKYAASVARAFERTYSRRLTYSKTLMVDEGSEFKGAVNRLMEENDVRI